MNQPSPTFRKSERIVLYNVSIPPVDSLARQYQGETQIYPDLLVVEKLLSQVKSTSYLFNSLTSLPRTAFQLRDTNKTAIPRREDNPVG